MCACEKGDIECVRFLVEKGADVASRRVVFQLIR